MNIDILCCLSSGETLKSTGMEDGCFDDNSSSYSTHAVCKFSEWRIFASENAIHYARRRATVWQTNNCTIIIIIVYNLYLFIESQNNCLQINIQHSTERAINKFVVGARDPPFLEFYVRQKYYTIWAWTDEHVASSAVVMVVVQFKYCIVGVRCAVNCIVGVNSYFFCSLEFILLTLYFSIYTWS